MTKKDLIHKTRIFILAKTWFILCMLLILSSCFSVKPGATKAGGKLFETFFVGEEGTQYFIKPLKFTNEKSESLKLDITFRYKNEIKDSAIVNLSFLSNDLFKSIDSLRIDNGEYSTLIKELNLLFAERSKDMYNIRFSTKVNLADIKKLFERNDWRFLQYRNGESTLYTPNKATKKKIDKLNYEVFELF